MGRNALTPKQKLVKWAKSRATRKGLPFAITVEDFEIPSTCPVLGIPLYSSVGQAGDNSPTIDRIVPELGYVRGNILVISMRANRIKYTASWHELTLIVDFYEDYIINKWMKGIP